MLSEVTHVIMDEVHERNLSSDFLAIIMRDLLQRRFVHCILCTSWILLGYCEYTSWILLYTLCICRPDLKLILMSATLNAELFSSYFSKPRG